MSDNRSPDAIQREIEATRAELADTIDAIADRVSPRKAATRSAAAVKAQVSAALGQAEKAASGAGQKVKSAAPGPTKEPAIQPQQVEQADSGRVVPGSGPTALDATAPMQTNGLPSAVLDATPDQAARRTPVATLHQRSLRTDRVLLSVGVAAALVGVAVLVRGRRD